MRKLVSSESPFEPRIGFSRTARVGRASRGWRPRSSRSPAMDFTGYRKIASTCPISMNMLDVSLPNR